MAGRFKQAFRVASVLVLAGVAAFGTSAGVAAGEHTASLGGALATAERPVYVTVGEPTRPPIGWVEFCIEYKPECATTPSEPRDVVLTSKAWTDMVKVNAWVNRVNQTDHRPRTLGRGRALELSRRRLRRLRRLCAAQAPHARCRQAGRARRCSSPWCATRRATATPYSRSRPIAANSFSTIRKTQVLPWTKTGYRFVKRQSQTDPNLWVSLGEPRAAPATVFGALTEKEFAFPVTSPPLPVPRPGSRAAGPPPRSRPQLLHTRKCKIFKQLRDGS